jgi:hypothetical protein
LQSARPICSYDLTDLIAEEVGEDRERHGQSFVFEVCPKRPKLPLKPNLTCS